MRIPPAPIMCARCACYWCASFCVSDEQEAASGGTGEAEPSPPPRIGLFVDEVYHKVGAANDLVIVKGEDGSLTTSDFHVRGSSGQSRPRLR